MPVFDADIHTPGLSGGIDRDTTAVGTGIAIPPGLECVLEYNGLFLNTQDTADRYRVNSIDGLMDSDIRDTRDENTDDHGETPFNSFYGGRTIVIAGTIQTHSVGKLRDMQRGLRNAFVDISQERPLHFRTGDFSKDVVIYGKKSAPISGIEQQTNLAAARDFQITLRCSNPRFLSYYARNVEAYPTVSTKSFIWLGTVFAYGNFEAQPTVRFYGPFTWANVYNDATKQTLKVNGIGANDWIEFDMAHRTLKNSAGVNMWNKLADDSDFMNLIPGENYFEYQGDCPHIGMEWRDAWM